MMPVTREFRSTDGMMTWLIKEKGLKEQLKGQFIEAMCSGLTLSQII